MNDSELQSLWKSIHSHTPQSISSIPAINGDMAMLKAKKLLKSARPLKRFALAAGILWVLLAGSFMGTLVFENSGSINLFLVCSISLQILITAIATGIYLYQIYLIDSIDFSEPVIKIQQQLSELMTATLRAARILILQLPLWTTFYWNTSMFLWDNLPWWIIQGFITLLFCAVALWLYHNIRIENRHKKWFQWLFSGREWQPVLECMELAEQIDDFKKNGA